MDASLPPALGLRGQVTRMTELDKNSALLRDKSLEAFSELLESLFHFVVGEIARVVKESRCACHVERSAPPRSHAKGAKHRLPSGLRQPRAS